MKSGVKAFVFLVFFSLLLHEDANGQKNSNNIRRKKVIRYRKHTKIELDKALLQGELKDPSRLDITLSPKRDLKSPLKPRTDFLKELRRDVSQVR